MRAPFNSFGDLLHHAPWGYEPDWRDFEPTRMSLMLDGMLRGRSAAYFMWKRTPGDLTQERYPMFMKDMVDLINDSIIQGGFVVATFAVVKRGANYGIRRVGP